MKDYFGRVICVGDWVVYPTSVSSSIYMHVAKVLEVTNDGYYIEKETDRWNGTKYVPHKKRVKIYRTERSIIIPEELACQKLK